MSDVFISYARSTEAEAKRIGEALRALGYGVWRDDEIPAHRAYADVISERLKAAKAVLVVWSAEAAASEWVRSEAEKARAERKLVQLNLDGTELPMPFDQIQCADLSGWSGEDEHPGWRKIAASIADLVGAGSQAARPVTRPRPKLAICVLPFVNISGDPEQEYFSDGISEDIITDLSKVSALSVTARNNAFTFKGKTVEVQHVARQFGVSHVLEGSVRKAGGRVRITAQLIDGAAGDHLWAERWDRDLTDIFALQDEISQAIVSALKLKLLPEEKKAIEKRGTTNADAYKHYLMARMYLDTGSRGDGKREEAIVRLCRRAVEIDPAYARAWALLGYAQANLALSRQVGEDGLADAERALQLDGTLAEPHAVKANVFYHSGRRDEAFAEADLALRLDPESHEVNAAVGAIFYSERRLEEASVCFRKLAALTEADFGSSGMLASCLTALGDLEGARTAARVTLGRVEKIAALDRINGHAMAYGADALAVLGEGERAREWMDRAVLIDPDNWLMRYNFACALSIHLHDADGAIEILGPVMASGPLRLASAAITDPDLDPLRDDPRFKAILAAAEARAVVPAA